MNRTGDRRSAMRRDRWSVGALISDRTDLLTAEAPYHSGIGGGGFGLVRGANGSYKMVDFREIAGQNANQNMYAGNYNGSLIGGLST